MKTSEAVQMVGSVKKLADLLDISHQAVYAWGDTVPELRVYQILYKLLVAVPSFSGSQPGLSPSDPTRAV